MGSIKLSSTIGVMDNVSKQIIIFQVLEYYIVEDELIKKFFLGYRNGETIQAKCTSMDSLILELSKYVNSPNVNNVESEMINLRKSPLRL